MDNKLSDRVDPHKDRALWTLAKALDEHRASSSDKADNWQVKSSRSGDGDYYYNTKNKFSTWDKPRVFMSDEELIVELSTWQFIETDDENATAHFYEACSDTTSWNEPDVIVRMRDLLCSRPATAAAAEQIDSSVNADADCSSRQSMADSSFALLPDEERRKLFRQLLVDKAVSADGTWADCKKLLLKDDRYQRFRHFGQQQGVFNKYRQEMAAVTAEVGNGNAFNNSACYGSQSSDDRRASVSTLSAEKCKEICARIGSYSLDSSSAQNTRHIATAMTECFKSNRSQSMLLLGLDGGSKRLLLRKAADEAISRTHGMQDVRQMSINCRLYQDSPSAICEIIWESLLGNIDYESLSTGERQAALIQRLSDKSSGKRPSSSAYQIGVVILNYVEVLLTQSLMQALVYELLDGSLARPLFIVGVSDRLDVLELMEKRLRSRFSHRVIVPSCGFLESFTDYQQFVEHLLYSSLDDDSWKSAVRTLLTNRRLNTQLERLHEEQSNDVGMLRTVLAATIRHAKQHSAAKLDADFLSQLIEQQLCDPIVTTIASLTLFQLLCLLAAVHVVVLLKQPLDARAIAVCYETKLPVSTLELTRDGINAAVDELCDDGLLERTDSHEYDHDEETPIELCCSLEQLEEGARARALREALPIGADGWLKELLRCDTTNSNAISATQERAGVPKAASTVRRFAKVT